MELLLVLLGVLFIHLIFYLIYLFFIKKGWIVPVLNTYTQKKEPLHFFFFSQFSFLILVIFVLLFFKVLFSIVILFFSFPYILKTIKKIRSKNLNNISFILNYSQEDEKNANDSFSPFKNQKNKLIVTSKIVFTETSIHYSKRKKMHFNPSILENMEFESFEFKNDFLVIHYTFVKFHFRSYYIFIPKNQKKQIERWTKIIEKNVHKSYAHDELKKQSSQTKDLPQKK